MMRSDGFVRGAVFAALALARAPLACCSISAWRFLRATRSRASEGEGVGVSGGGPGTEGCGSGVAHRDADVCRQW